MIDEEQKRKLLVELEKNGIVHFACMKTGISRATYYRWRGEDTQFLKQSERAVVRGRENNCDIAEQALMLKVKDKDMGAIKYVLSHNSPRYKARRESSATIRYDIPQKVPQKPEKTLEDLLRDDAIRKIQATQAQANPNDSDIPPSSPETPA